MRSYVLLKEFEPQNVACVQGSEVRIQKLPAYPPCLREPVFNVLESGYDTVTLLAYGLHESPGGWKARIPGQLGYHDKSGTIFHTEDFPVWEWLLIEILANLAEQWRVAPWCRRCSDTCEIPTVDPDSWQEARYWYATCTRRFGDCEDV